MAGSRVSHTASNAAGRRPTGRLPGSRPLRKDLAAKFEARLAEIVDCGKVDAQTVRYDRQSFSGFKAQAGQGYDGIMRGIYPGWDEEVKPVVEGWPAQDGEG